MISRYFWGDNRQELSVNKHKKYISTTLLEKGNSRSIQWLRKNVDKKELKKYASSKKISQKSRNFWQLFF